ncbi:uncharacterized protein HMPREF1541_09630 [Cyphellophora europaea CBS 101466]|uniref:NADPH--hemoprotein reductase n=1 Tax=Cyphellophora europaea (strain CBS 101466) TaxID=1220924 RepID=W2SAR8_CYPE1|nr:uncharacterized protein HMPREF1541_09630 [Cyphellophora europaea CBS 101466]ETN45797.1 hypothetical protein HMPREF1541_09630 [Cyphellophora europaea CBS 101466]
MNVPTSDAEVLALALGAPARQVLNHAQARGPATGWKDGYLTTADGFCPPDPEHTYMSLRRSLGDVWAQLCSRLPALKLRGKVRQSILAIPVVGGTSDTIPDHALWAAVTCLNILAGAYQHEERSDGKDATLAGEGDLQVPKTISVPLQQVSKRLGRAQPFVSAYEFSLCNYRLVHGPHNLTNERAAPRMSVLSAGDGVDSLSWTSKLHISFTNGVELVTQSQERTMADDADGLMRVLVDLTKAIKDLIPILRMLSAEELRGNKTQADLCAPLTVNSPPYSELGLPIFQLMHAFTGKKIHSASLNSQIAEQRPWLPVNVRAFLAAIECHFPVYRFVEQSGHPQLRYAWDALVQSYCGDNGLLSLYEQKSSASAQLAAKTGHSVELTDGDSNDSIAFPWQIDERNAMAHQSSRQDFEHCSTRARVTSRSRIDDDSDRENALVSLLVQEPHGLSFEPGDRLLVMPLNPWSEVEKIAAALGLDNSLDTAIPMYGGTSWDQFARQLHPKANLQASHLTVQDVLRYGQIAPLTRSQVYALDKTFHGTCPLITRLLDEEIWPIMGTLGDVLQLAIEEVSPIIWDTVFDLSHLSWLPEMIPVAVPRAYGISSPALMGTSLPSSVKITVQRVTYKVHPSLDGGLESPTGTGMSSCALNPHPAHADDHLDGDDYPFMIGVAPASVLRLRSTPLDNVVMFAEANSLGIFRSFWRSRTHCMGQTVLFLALQTLQKFAFEEELKRLQRSNSIKVFTSSATETDFLDKKRLLSSAILDQGQLVCDMLASTANGGLGGHFYISGSMNLWQSVVAGIRRALYNSDFMMVATSVDDLIAHAIREGRMVLDVYSSPSRPLKLDRQISLAQLAGKTAHRPNTELWLAISDNIYDLTALPRLRPCDAAIVRLNAGLDATLSLSLLIKSTPELRNVLPEFMVGRLSRRQTTSVPDDRALQDLWTNHLRIVVETLTALAFETTSLLKECTEWFKVAAGRDALRDFLRAQARVFHTGVSSIFGVQLQELHVRTAFAHINKTRPDVRIPDVMGVIARARSSPWAATAVKELQILETLSRSNKLTSVQTTTAVEYAQAVTELEIHLLESVRDDIRNGFEVLEKSPAVDETVTRKLLTVLDHVAYRYQAFWERLALESVGRSKLEKTRLRMKYDMVQKPTTSGKMSTSLIAHVTDPPVFSAKHEPPAYTADHMVNFAHLIDQAMQTVNEENLMAAYTSNRSRSQLTRAIVPTAKAMSSVPEPTTFDMFHRRRSVRALTSFLGSSETAIKRLSQLPAELSFAYIMATYGRNATNSENHTRSSSAARNVLRTLDSQAGNDTPRPRLIRRRTNASSISSTAPQSIFSSPEAGTPETRASVASSPALPLQLTLRSRERSGSRATSQARLSKSSVSVDLNQAAHILSTRPSPPGRTQSATAIGTEIVSSVSIERGHDEPPTKGTRLPALLPSPLLPEQVPIAEKGIHTRRWEMPLVSLSTAERQSNNKGQRGNPLPGIPLQSVNIPPMPPAISLPSVLGHTSPRQTSLRAFSAKELPIITLSQSAKHNMPTKAGRVVQTHWEMPLFTLSTSEKQAITSKRQSEIHPPAVPLQSKIKPPPVIEMSATLPVMPASRHSARPQAAFSGRQLPLLTLSQKERRGAVRQEGPIKIGVNTRKPVSNSSNEASNRTSHAAGIRGLWTHPADQYATSTSLKLGQARTLGHVGMWMRPEAKISNEDFLGYLAECRRHADLERRSARALTGLNERALAGLWKTSHENVPSPSSWTRGYVGMWMSPPSRKQNEDFELVRRGGMITPLSMSTTIQATYSNLAAQSTEAKRIATETGTPSKRSTHLWHGGLSEHVPATRWTAGYVGMWMRPASRIQNTDFEILRAQTTRTARQASVRRVPPSQPDSIVVKSYGLWQSTLLKDEVVSHGCTLGSVGMWMCPRSKKANTDFAYLVLNTVNYLLGTNLSLLQRMANDCMLVSAELHNGPWNLKDWTKPGRSSKGTHSIALPTTARAPVTPGRASQPSSYRGQTLGQVGTWMYPPSKKRNLDFECFRAAVEAAPELEPTKAARSGHPKEIDLKSTPQVTREKSSGYTAGFVGLWMDPPSRKVNEDFEWAKQHAHEVFREQSVKPLLPVAAGLFPVVATTQHIHAPSPEELDVAEEPVYIIQRPSPTQQQYDFLAESPMLSKQQTAGVTPTSASTTDGMARHEIDFAERLRKLNAELEMDDSDYEDDLALPGRAELRYASSKMSLPFSQESITERPSRGTWEMNITQQRPECDRAKTEPAEVTRRPVLKEITVDSPRVLNGEGLEVFTAISYYCCAPSASFAANSKDIRPRHWTKPIGTTSSSRSNTVHTTAEPESPQRQEHVGKASEPGDGPPAKIVKRPVEIAT